MKNALCIFLLIFGLAFMGCGAQQHSKTSTDEASSSKGSSSSGGFQDGAPYYGPNDTDMTVSPGEGSSGADTSGGYEPPHPDSH